jgi:hypothetical protein
MHYLTFIILGLLSLLIIVFFNINRKLINLRSENKILKEKINNLSEKLPSTENESIHTNVILEYDNVIEEYDKTENKLIPVEIESFKLDIEPQIKNNQQHYYIVKEFLKDIINETIISNNEFMFTNQNLYTSKVEARLFYDKKIANLSYNDVNFVLEYELYIVNNVFYDKDNIASASENSTNDIKKYLLIDSGGEAQTEGRNFESFALRVAANKMNKKHENQANFISTKNSFLDGNYKD